MTLKSLDGLKIRIVDIGQKMLSYLFGSTSRTAEYRFVFENLPEVQSNILDIGCSSSLLSIKLAKAGHNVVGIDTRRYLERHANFNYVHGDITAAPFIDNYFDVVTAVSTIEHIGLGAYGDPIIADADFKSMSEIRRILRPGGKLIVTTPFAGKYGLANWQGMQERYYDMTTLKELFKGFRTEVEKFFIGKSLYNWVDATIEEAVRPDLKWHANIALLLTKQ